MMTVKDLIKVLGDFPPDDSVAILPDNAEISAKICRGGIALDGGWLVMNLKTGDSAGNSVKNVGRMTMTLDEWISRFDNEEADKLTQDEQLEIKSMLIELRWRRDEMNDFTETMKDRAEAWLGAYNNQEGWRWQRK